jgi:hypothetical protein
MTDSNSPFPSINRLLAFIEHRERELHETSSIEVAAVHQVEFNAVYGICAQAIRYAGAYVVLHRANRTREAVSVARQALEHALTAQWAHFTEAGPDLLIDSYHHSRLRVFEAVTRHLQGADEEIADVLSTVENRGTQLLRVTDRIAAIDFDEMFKIEYMRQSQIVHVTSETVTTFVHVNDQKELVITSDASDPDEGRTAYFTAMAAMFAAWVLESLRVGTPGMAQLNSLSDELNLPLNISV